MVGAGNDLKDNLRVAVVKDLEAALSLAEAMRGRDYLQQAGCRFEETEAADIIQQANFFPETLSWADTVKPRNSGLLYQPEFFHYCGFFHYFGGQAP